ncbi:MAG: hypothetical protein QXW42_09240, partial [Thermofilum sp.]|uniref:hypothetical protein n=1 Tax=Thermofilum sp. TaxID=1961369 RepID=UPI003164B15E
MFIVAFFYGTDYVENGMKKSGETLCSFASTKQSQASRQKPREKSRQKTPGKNNNPPGQNPGRKNHL